jgi:hypothetical protein
VFTLFYSYILLGKKPQRATAPGAGPVCVL